MRKLTIAALPLLTTFVSLVRAQEHLDALALFDPAHPSTIPTGSFDFDGFAVVDLPPKRVYGNDLEDPFAGAGFLSGEAGFTGLAAEAAQTQLNGTGYTHLPASVTLRFDYTSFSLNGGGSQANLWYWDGLDQNGNGDPADDIAFAPAIGSTFSLEKFGGAFSASVTGTAAAAAGFAIDTTAVDNPGTAQDETGFFHLDLDALLSGNAGIYVIGMHISYPGATSEELFWVYNAGLGEAGEAAHDAAIAYVPEPATGVGAALAMLLLARRRRAQ